MKEQVWGLSWQRRVVRRIGRGEAAALAELYDRTAGRVYRVAVVMTGSQPVGEDITRAVFLHAWRHPGALLKHQDQLCEYLTEMACHHAAFWRVHRRAPHPSPASPAAPEPPRRPRPDQSGAGCWNEPPE